MSTVQKWPADGSHSPLSLLLRLLHLATSVPQLVPDALQTVPQTLVGVQQLAL